MTRTVADAAAMLTVLELPDDRDGNLVPFPPAPPILPGIKGWRVAYSPRLGRYPVEGEVAQSIDAAASALAAAGATVELVDPPLPAGCQDAWFTFWNAGAARVGAGIPAARHDELDPGFRASIEAGQRLSALDWLAAEAIRADAMTAMQHFHQTYDLLVCPSVGVPALAAGDLLSNPATEQHWTDWAGFAYPFNLSRQPALSLPCGLTAAGLPIGVQLVGRYGADRRVLHAGAVLEAALGFSMRHPLPC
jgi:aspartyl-tRNA(Asn)/glutamyl-tRNA(Gln) amidotransferase subunit A